MIISLKSGDVVFNDKKVHLTKNEMTVLKTLNKQEITTIVELYNMLYGVNVKELSKYDKRLIYVIISRIRKKLENGLIIHNVYDYGYRIEVVNG